MIDLEEEQAEQSANWQIENDQAYAEFTPANADLIDIELIPF